MPRHYCEHHCHGEYSLLDGTGPAEHYAKRAAELGYTHLNKTDHGTMAGTLHHIRACQEVGIMGTAGCEVYFKPDRTVQSTAWQEDPNHYKREFHLTITANSLKGWQNLIKLTSLAWIEGFYQYPCIDYELLEQYGEGIVVTSACISSYLAQALLHGDEANARYFASRVSKAVGGRFWIEIMPHDWDEQRELNILLYNFAQKEGYPLLATNDVHYATKDYAGTQKILMMCATGTTNLDKKAKKEAGEQVYGDSDMKSLFLMDGDQIYEHFVKNHPDLPTDAIEEAIANSVEITKDFRPYVVSRDYKVPKAIKSDSEAKKTLERWIAEGYSKLKGRWKELGLERDYAVYDERIAFELKTFYDLDVYHYMILVADLVRWAKSDEGVEPGTKKEPIAVGLGRGSAAGSLVSFLIGIIGVEPIAWDLLFERFLNPERHGMPDIDIDFDSDRREEVKAYLIRKYGQDKVATVSSKGTYAARSVIESIGKVYDDVIPYTEITAMKEEIDKNVKSLAILAEEVPLARDFARNYPEAWDHMIKLEDQIKNNSQHASAFVITDKPLLDLTPLETRANADDKKGDRIVVTAFTDAASYPIIAEFGFLKIDILATKGVSKIRQAGARIKELYGKVVDPWLFPLCLDPNLYDPAVVKSLGRKKNLGVFQFNSAGMQSFMEEHGPETAEDLVADNAIYRPGSMGQIGKFIRRRHGEERFDSWHEKTDKIMARTYGVIIYQETVMQIAKELGNFTAGQADSLRKAIGKLYRLGKAEAMAYMETFHDQWSKGCQENGISPSLAQEIWEYILDFGGYGFNRSHSVCYAIQGYVDAWIKYYYPEVFYETLFSREPELLGQAIPEAKELGVTVTAPDVNRSELGFRIDGKELIFGLTAIRDMGQAAATPIVSERAANGPYKSIDEFLDRCSKVDVGSLKSLAFAGGFNSITPQQEILAQYLRQDRVVATLKDTHASGKNKIKTKKCWNDPVRAEELLDLTNWDEAEDILRLEHKIDTVNYLQLYRDNLALAKPVPIVVVQEPTKTELYDGERHAMGVNILHINPIYDPETLEFVSDYIDSEEHINYTPSSSELSFKQRHRSAVNLAGEVSAFEERKVKSGKNRGRKMASFYLTFNEVVREIVVFADDYEKVPIKIKDGDALLMIANKMSETEFSGKTIWRVQEFKEMVENGEEE